MFSKKIKMLLAFMLVLLLSCSFTVFVNAENNSGEVSNVSETSVVAESKDTESAANTESVAETDESIAATVSESDENAEESEDNAAAATTKNSWIGWAIAGGVILLIALLIFIAIKRKTPFGLKLVKFFKDYKSEMKKIVWLSKKDLVKQTGVVLVTILIAAIFLGVLDGVFTLLIQLI